MRRPLEPKKAPAHPIDCPLEPESFEAQQNELTHGRRRGRRDTERFLSHHRVIPVFKKGSRLQKQELLIEDHECDELRVLATLGGTKVNMRAWYNGP